MKHITKRLIWLGAALLVFGIGAIQLRAQKESGPLTPEDAARQFVVMTMSGVQWTQHQSPIISHKSSRALGNGVWRLVADLTPNISLDKFGTRTTRSKSNAVVQVSPPRDTTTRPVVCIYENGFWRVDVVQTYARWKNLDAQTALRRVLKLTGKALPGLRLNADDARDVCQTNLKNVAFGIMMYVQDNDEQFPPSKTWQDALALYVKDAALFKCPSVNNGKNGYAMNSKLSNETTAAVDSSWLTVLLYDSTKPGRSAAGDGRDIAFRHSGGANYAFSDGHIKWYEKRTKPQFGL